MSTMQHPGGASPVEASDRGREALSGAGVENAVAAEAPTTDGWTPEDRAPSAAESNFMSIALFAFLILFGVGCLIVF